MKTFSVKGEASPSGNMASIVLKGNITLANAEAVYAELLDAIPTSEKVQVEVRDLVDIDLSGLQLLVALGKFLQQKGMQVAYDIVYPADAVDLVERSGFNVFFEKSV